MLSQTGSWLVNWSQQLHTSQPHHSHPKLLYVFKHSRIQHSCTTRQHVSTISQHLHKHANMHAQCPKIHTNMRACPISACICIMPPTIVPQGHSWDFFESEAKNAAAYTSVAYQRTTYSCVIPLVHFCWALRLLFQWLSYSQGAAVHF